MTSEAQLQEQVADYLCLRYPNVLFHSDFGSGAKLTVGQAVKQKRQNGGRRAWPDMVIAERKAKYVWPKFLHIPNTNTAECGGLYLELKKDGENLFAKRNLGAPEKKSIDGNIYADEHIREQADVLYMLRKRGYVAEFAVGFDEAVKIIDEYLKEE